MGRQFARCSGTGSNIFTEYFLFFFFFLFVEEYFFIRDFIEGEVWWDKKKSYFLRCRRIYLKLEIGIQGEVWGLEVCSKVFGGDYKVRFGEILRLGWNIWIFLKIWIWWSLDNLEIWIVEWILDPFWNLRLDCIFESLNFKKFGFLYLKFEIFIKFRK